MTTKSYTEENPRNGYEKETEDEECSTKASVLRLVSFSLYLLRPFMI